jgi:hypothetical protein
MATGAEGHPIEPQISHPTLSEDVSKNDTNTPSYIEIAPRGMVADPAFLFGETIAPSDAEAELMLELMLVLILMKSINILHRKTST